MKKTKTGKYSGKNGYFSLCAGRKHAILCIEITDRKGGITMDKRYTGRQVLAIMREMFPNSEADFQPEFLDHFEHAVFSQDELEQLLETFPKTENQFRKAYTYHGL